MEKLMNEMNQRRGFLRQVVQEKKKSLSKVPEGVLNVAASGNRVQYYYKKGRQDLNKRYMQNQELPLVKALCQKDYDQRVLMSSEIELGMIERFIKFYETQKCEDIYEKLNPHRQKHVSPITLSDKAFVEQWEQVLYQPKGFKEDAPEYYTDKGERVRSKTEILIANALKKHNIPYRYEAPLYLNEFGTIHPDFTVLNVPLRKELYWEHMGMMDNSDYAQDAVRRIEMYEKNDIFPGDRLVLTYETSRYPMNSRMIEKMIFHYLK